MCEKFYSWPYISLIISHMSCAFSAYLNMSEILGSIDSSNHTMTWSSLVFHALMASFSAASDAVSSFGTSFLTSPVMDSNLPLLLRARVTALTQDELEVESRVMNSHRFSPATMAHRTLVMSQDIDMALGSISVASIGDISLNSRQNKSEIEPSAPELKGTSIPDAICAGELVVLVDGMTSQLFVSPSSSRQTDAAIEGKEVQCGKWKKISWKVSVYLVTLGMLIALLMGLNLSWTAITTALVLVVIDFRDAQSCLEKVSYSLLIFFCEMFITVDEFKKTGIPSALCDLVEPYAKINSASGVMLLSMVVLVLSNSASNVPTVLLLGSRVASSAAKISEAEVTKA